MWPPYFELIYQPIVPSTEYIQKPIINFVLLACLRMVCNAVWKWPINYCHAKAHSRKFTYLIFFLSLYLLRRYDVAAYRFRINFQVVFFFSECEQKFQVWIQHKPSKSKFQRCFFIRNFLNLQLTNEVYKCLRARADYLVFYFFFTMDKKLFPLFYLV